LSQTVCAVIRAQLRIEETGMFPANYDMNISSIACCSRDIPLVKNLDQAGLLFKGTKQLAHPVNVDKIRLIEDV